MNCNFLEFGSKSFRPIVKIRNLALWRVETFHEGKLELETFHLIIKGGYCLPLFLDQTRNPRTCCAFYFFKKKKKRVHVHQVHRLLNEQDETVWRLSTEKGFKTR